MIDSKGYVFGCFGEAKPGTASPEKEKRHQAAALQT